MILNAIVVLGVIGLLAAVLLYVAATRFKVEEDPRIAEIEELLPGANCGGCGLTGCHAFAVAVRNATTLEGLNCVVAGEEGMGRVARAVGLDPARGARKVATVKCANSCEVRQPTTYYDGVASCAIENSLYQGETDCVFGCLGGGDCVAACQFDAIFIPEGEGIPVVDPDKCTACGACVKKCPRGVLELQVWHKDTPNVRVACNNRNRGPLAMKDCSVSCIGCMKCTRVCESEAVKVSDFLAHIDSEKCVGCEKCVEACPRHSIVVLPSHVENEKI